MRTPKYRLHKSSGRALIEFDGRRYWLGKHGTAESKARFKAKVAEWAAKHGRVIEGASPTRPTAGPVLVKELILRFWSEHVTEYYKKHGRPTTTQNDIRTALKTLRRLYGDTPAVEFDQVRLDAYRNELIDVRRNRIGTVNYRINHVREMFRWGAEKKIVPASVWQELLTLKNLKPGRTRAEPNRRVPPVADQVIEQTLAHLPPIVAVMVRFQRLTGCRPGEVCSLRPCDIEGAPGPAQATPAGDEAPPVLPLRPAPATAKGAMRAIWIYRPEGHKTEHHGIERRVYIGPKAQEILRPYLDRPPEAFCFDRGTNQKRYAPGSYAQAIQRGLKRLAKSLGHKPPKPPFAKNAKPGQKPRRRKGWVPPRSWFESVGAPYWTPNQIRHTKATELEATFDPDAARVVLGHGDQRTTRIYAERDFARAEEVARQIG